MTRHILAVLLLMVASANSYAQSAVPDHAQKAFFMELSKHCGEKFEGTASVTPENKPEDAFLGKKLTMHIASCSANEIRVPFAIGENHSRTWIIRYDPVAGLSLKHEHRHEDGSLEFIAYGGIARNGGSTHAQFFPTDPETIKASPITATNVWMLTLAEDGNTFKYDIDRFGKPLYRTEMRKMRADVTSK